MLFSFFYARTKLKMGQFMNFATSAACALALSFLFYDRRDLMQGQRTVVDITRPGWEKRPGGATRPWYKPYEEPGLAKSGGT